MNCFAIKHQKIHTKCAVVYFCNQNQFQLKWKETFAFLTLISIEMTFALQETGMSKKEKKNDSFNKRQKYIQARMNMNLLQAPPGQANFGRR